MIVPLYYIWPDGMRSRQKSHSLNVEDESTLIRLENIESKFEESLNQGIYTGIAEITANDYTFLFCWYFLIINNYEEFCRRKEAPREEQFDPVRLSYKDLKWHITFIRTRTFSYS